MCSVSFSRDELYKQKILRETQVLMKKYLVISTYVDVQSNG